MFNRQFENVEVNTTDSIKLNAPMIPKFRFALAKKYKTLDNILILTNGGLGDVVCAEPTVRWARKNFPTSIITVSTNYPELFNHLGIDAFITLNEYNAMPEHELIKKYNFFSTLYPHETLPSEFMEQHQIFHVDYCSISAFGIQLEDKTIRLRTNSDNENKINSLIDTTQPVVVLHAGVTWKSKILPTEYLDELVYYLNQNNVVPIIIGSDKTQNKDASFKVPTAGRFIDLTNKLEVMDLVYLLQNADAVITNESSPLHIAASSSKANIAFFATAKRPELLMHYRPLKGYKMKNFAKSGRWDKQYTPWQDYDYGALAENFDITGWLEDPKTVVDWALNSIHFPIKPSIS